MKSKNSPPIVIFADGASSGNPGPGGWGAILVTPTGQVTELGGSESPTTNNRMELTATIRALEYLRTQTQPQQGSSEVIEIYSDSTYVIRGITQWIWNWRKRGWVSSEGKEIANTDLWQKLSQLTFGLDLKWKYVRGHSGVPGNERVDEIAVQCSKGKRPSLYQGTLLKYGIPIYDLPENTTLPDLKSSKNKSPSKPYSYLSVIGNLPMRHSSWQECERRVKGQPGAKFKKSMTSEEEAQILADWGFNADDLPK